MIFYTLIVEYLPVSVVLLLTLDVTDNAVLFPLLFSNLAFEFFVSSFFLNSTKCATLTAPGAIKTRYRAVIERIY